jgi:predicted dehydrogenase
MSVAPLPPGPSLSASRSSLDSERPLRVAVIGAGVMGKRHARVLASRAERFALVAVRDTDPKAAAELAHAHGVEVAATDADAIARADAVVVATPIGVHASSVRRALANGRHVLVEKPIAATAREARELVALAEASGVRLFVGHSERFNPVVRALVRLVAAETIESVGFRRIGSVRSARGSSEGALVNLGVHDFDLAAYLASSPLTLTSVGDSTGTEPRGAGAEERAEVAAVTAAGAQVHVLVDQHPADTTRRRALTLSTRTHLWEGNLLSPSLVRTCRATGVREAIPLDTEEPLLAQALAFVGAVRAGIWDGAGGGSGKGNEIATGHDGMRALLVAEGARRALATGRVRGENLAFPHAFDTR